MSSQDTFPAESAQRKHRHSRIHSRNLSIYFPRPDQLQLHHSLDSPITPSNPLDIPPANIIVWDHQHQPLPTFSDPIAAPPINTGTWSPASANDSHTRTRRGHHHRHSLSHNFFPFLAEKEVPTSLRPTDTTSTLKINPPTSNSKSFNNWKFPVPPKTPLSAIPKPVPYNQPLSKKSLPRNSINETKLERKITHLNMPSKLLINLYFYTDPITKVKILSGLLTGLLGCYFWLKAQDIQFLSLSGLGYVLVFDAIGSLYRIWFDGDADGIERVWESLGTKNHDSNIKLPFGRARVNTLGQFSQALYLVFSGIYIAKEAFEHLLISHPHHPTSDHSVTASSATDLHHQDHTMEIPIVLILLSELLVLFSALVSKNHQSLTELIDVKDSSNLKNQKTNGYNFFKINQFSALSLVFGGLIALSGCIFSPSQLEKADGFISCLMVYSIFKLAWPLASLTGKVLLQTAPLESESKTLSRLNSTIEMIQKGDEPVIKKTLLYIEPIKVWRLTILESDLICNVVVHVKEDTQDEEILQVTEVVRGALVGIGSEITVDVLRGDEKKSLVRPSAAGGCSHHHDPDDHHHHHDDDGHHHHDHDHDEHHHHDHDGHHHHHHGHVHHHHEGKVKELESKAKLIAQISSDHSSGEEDEICSSSDDDGHHSTADDHDQHHHHQLGHLHPHPHLHLH